MIYAGLMVAIIAIFLLADMDENCGMNGDTI
jgi:capsular polysaccharide biosynthesis protein